MGGIIDKSKEEDDDGDDEPQTHRSNRGKSRSINNGIR